jgi:hypothetical protein
VVARSYGAASCSTLAINSARGTRDTAGATPELFKRHRRAVVAGGGAGEPDGRPGEPPQGLGAFLSAQDLDAVAALVQEFATRTLLPRLEERITRLNACISATRKGEGGPGAALLCVPRSLGPPATPSARLGAPPAAGCSGA